MQQHSYKKYFIIDTNIILEDFNNIHKLSQGNKNLIILPETVLDEIDSKKNGVEEINYQARSFARMLENSIIQETLDINIHKIVILIVEDLTIHIISKKLYDCEQKQTQNKILNDRKILEIAQFAREEYSQNVEFISNDIMARVRGTSLGLKTNFLKGDGKDITDIVFYKIVTIEFSELESLHGRDIKEIDPNYTSENFTYHVKVRNSDQVILCGIKNQKIDVLNESELRDQIIMPLNQEQLFYSYALQENYFNIILVEAIAGSGKTLLALSSAIKMVRKKYFHKIIYIRNSIESLDRGEDIGYLPGYEEKFEIYNHPLHDSLRFIATMEHKSKGKNNKNYTPLDEAEITQKVNNTISNYNIETMWIGEMRGRTLSESFIIVDESQNMSNKTMQMVLSRIDSTCKVVVIGSNKQIDNFYINKYTNSLTTLLKATKIQTNYVNLFAIKLKKVLRGPITEWAESIF